MMDELRTMARNPQHYSNCTMAIALHQVLDRLEAAERERNAIERNRDGWRMAAEDAHGHTLAAEHERDELRDQLTASQAREAGLREALERIADWASSYPVDVFEPLSPGMAQFADNVLKEAGISMGALHAGWARHILTGIGGIVESALSAAPPREGE